MTRNRRRVAARTAGLLAALCLAATSTVALAQRSSTAAFTGQTAVTGNTVTSAASFCAVPDGATYSVVNDTYVDEAVPGTARGGAASLKVGAGSGVIAHAYLRFTLPSLQPHCTVTSATLRLYATSSSSGTILAHRASTTWASATNTWSTVPRPAPAGTGVGATTGAVGWHEWNVTTLTRELLAGANDGFLIKDAVETNPVRATQYESLDSLTVANRPQLVITWG